MALKPFHMLHFNQLEVDLCPELGGAVAGFRINGFPLLRPWNEEVSVRRMAAYPLVPYSNRIAEGQFSVEGQNYTLAKNFGNHPHSLHGIGWQRQWQLVPVNQSQAKLVLEHQANGDNAASWPFSFRAEQTITLEQSGLTLSMTCQNLSDSVMPVGLGWHPFFPRHQGIELAFKASHVWRNSDRMLPEALVELLPEWDFSTSRAVDYPALDNCFAHWNGAAYVHWPAQGITVEITGSQLLRHLVVMVPPEPADFLAVEPVSHANNAINQPQPEQHGLRFLLPQQSASVEMNLTIRRV